MRNKKYLIILFSLLVIIVLLNCTESIPIEEKKLVKVYAEMVIMQDSTTLSTADIQKKVLGEFDISISDYEKSVDFLSKNPERWQNFYDSVIVYLQRLEPLPKTPDKKILPKRLLSPDKKNL
ncbi:MAG: DUF4296 domain-containing protein [Ignavibacterium sp.]|jgi:F0F1-type ATP synthase membrane subunit a|nr:DUF4296 domain-containing protein [Ignavibacterium sp.]